jgi:trehalose 6-phosphate phosphatase
LVPVVRALKSADATSMLRPQEASPPTVAWPDTAALFLDIDGTLLDLAPHPDAVVVDDDVRGLLDALQGAHDGAMALVSGRTLADIDRLFAPRRFAAAGLHGLEWRQAATANAVLLPTPRGLRTLSVELADRLARFPGVLLERKGPALALHFRRAPEAEAAVCLAARDALARLGSGYRLLEGHCVVELLPAAANKGAAVQRFMAAPPFAGRRPVFIGDDITDESGFAAVNTLGGFSVRVGKSAPTAARFTVGTVAAARHWLAGLANPRRTCDNQASEQE